MIKDTADRANQIVYISIGWDIPPISPDSELMGGGGGVWAFINKPENRIIFKANLLIKFFIVFCFYFTIFLVTTSPLSDVAFTIKSPFALELMGMM